MSYPSLIFPFLGFAICFLCGGLCRTKKANALPRRASAHGRPRCQGRRGEPFIGAQRRPFTEEAGGAGACFASEEQLNFVKVSYRTANVAVVGEIFCFRYVKPEIGGLARNVQMEI